MSVSPPKSDIVCRVESQVDWSFVLEKDVIAFSSLFDGAGSAVESSVVGVQRNYGSAGTLIHIDDAHGLLRDEGKVL